MEIVRSSIRFDEKDRFSQYCSTISNSYCPYLKISERENILNRIDLDLTSYDIDLFCSELFYQLVFIVEDFRHKRKNLKGVRSIYYCDNVVIEISKALENQASELFAWPHWILKSLYSCKEIMFGKFWKNEVSNSRDNKPITPPTDNFFSIRSAFKNRDPYFLNNTPNIALELIESIDDMENIHASFGISLSNCTINHLRKLDYYSILKEWSKTKLPSNN